MRLRTYADFLDLLRERGLIWFSSGYPAGLPSLSECTEGAQWHTGDPDTDPWQWRERVAAERRAAVGNVLGGRKGFIAPVLYPLFFAASRPPVPLEERYADGLVPRMQQRALALFMPGQPLSTFELRAALIGPKKEGLSKMTSALEALMREFYITVCGSKRKTNALGQPYAWPAVNYALAEDWHGDWLAAAPLLSQGDAREALLAHCVRVGAQGSEAALRRTLWKS